jgi:hypothetical protein
VAGPKLTDEETAQKRAIYESIPPRRRKFIDKLGYDNWDPFQKPFDPIDIRVDDSKRTSKQLMEEFLASLPPETATGTDYSRGAWEMCLGVINGSERFRGILDFCQWYAGQKEHQK